MSHSFDDLTDENVLLYAIKAYDRPICVLSEFEADYKRVKYIKRLIGRFKQSGELKERNILNHIIIFDNVFGIEAATRLLFFKIDETDYDILKTFLVFLNFMPGVVFGIRGNDIKNINIPLNVDVFDKLGKATGNGTANKEFQ
jgi:hypothetical protein